MNSITITQPQNDTKLLEENLEKIKNVFPDKNPKNTYWTMTQSGDKFTIEERKTRVVDNMDNAKNIKLGIWENIVCGFLFTISFGFSNPFTDKKKVIFEKEKVAIKEKNKKTIATLTEFIDTGFGSKAKEIKETEAWKDTFVPKEKSENLDHTFASEKIKLIKKNDLRSLFQKIEMMRRGKIDKEQNNLLSEGKRMLKKIHRKINDTVENAIWEGCQGLTEAIDGSSTFNKIPSSDKRAKTNIWDIFKGFFGFNKMKPPVVK